MKRVGLFGSSVNPPTGVGGHVSIVKYFSGIFDEIWIFPVYNHIFDSKRGTLVSYDHRMEMSRLAFASIDNAKVISVEKDVYMERNQAKGEDGFPERIGTYDIVKYLENARPDAVFTLILGADTFHDILEGKWKHGDWLLKHLKFCVIDRHGSENLQEYIQEHKNVTLHDIDEICESKEISSTFVRKCCEELQFEQMRTYVVPKVYDYIISNRLYEG